MIHVGKIEKIIANNEKNNYFTATVTWLDTPGGFYNEASISAQVKLSYGHISRSFGFQYYPVPGDVIVCGFLTDGHPIVLAYLSSDYYNKIIDNNAYGYYFRKIVQGEYSLKGLKGNEIYIDRQGSLRFITRDQDIVVDVLKTYEQNQTRDISNQADKSAAITKIELESANYVAKLNTETNNDNGFVVDLTQQVCNYPKTEVTVGKVYDETYTTEQQLNGASIALQVIGKQNTVSGTDDNGVPQVTTEDVYSLTVNTNGEIELKRNDGKYNISIDKDGNMTITGNQIKVNAQTIVAENPNVVVDGKGPFCALPQCLFTGAVHTGSIAQAETSEE